MKKHLLIALLSASLMPALALADKDKDGENGKAKNKAQVQTESADQASPGNKGGKPMPYGLQKRVANGKGLPPGWDRKLKKGDILDEAIVAEGRPVDREKNPGIPLDPKGLVTLQIDKRIVRLIEDTREVIEIFR